MTRSGTSGGGRTRPDSSTTARIAKATRGGSGRIPSPPSFLAPDVFPEPSLPSEGADLTCRLSSHPHASGRAPTRPAKGATLPPSVVISRRMRDHSYQRHHSHRLLASVYLGLPGRPPPVAVTPCPATSGVGCVSSDLAPRWNWRMHKGSTGEQELVYGWAILLNGEAVPSAPIPISSQPWITNRDRMLRRGVTRCRAVCLETAQR
jgi:hypothetical protein